MEWANGLMALGLGSWALFKLSRPYFSSHVECWFCQGDAHVDFYHRHSWRCPHCHQYNGFNAEGDYNWQDPDKFRQIPESSPPRHAPPSNGLCRSCNLNQSLKTHQLAKFEPRYEANYDAEIEAYAAHLEKTYRLCRTCEASVLQTLGEQDSQLKPKLLSWKLEANRQAMKRAQEILRVDLNRQKSNNLALGFNLIAWIGLVCVHQLWIHTTGPHQPSGATKFSYIPLGLILGAFLLASISNLFLASATKWARALVLSLFLALSILELLSIGHMVQGLWPVTFLPWIMGASGCSLGLPMLQAWPGVRKRGPKLAALPYQPNLSRFNHELVEDTEETMTQDLISSATPTKSRKVDSIRSPHKESRPGSLLPEPILEKNLSDLLQNHEVHIEASLNGGQCDISALSIDGSSNHSPSPPISKSMSQPPNAHNGSVFQPRTYCPRPSLAINFGGRDMGQRGSILRPPTFKPKGVTRTSWVAGGYWQSKNPNHLPLGAADDISRSSSQTSGFVSNTGGPNGLPFGSSLPNSRTNSLFGDDRNSVLSAPVFKPTNFPPRPNSTLDPNPLGFGRQQFSPHHPVFSNLSQTRANSQAADSSFDSDFDRLTQSAFDELKPKAKSSPIPVPDQRETLDKSPGRSVLERQIQLNCSVQSLLFGLSIVINVGVAGYIAWQNIY
ncbi:hypothetical protein TCAL_15600 [Tigriopus californicus]|uniref:Ima1 N-terminal domain-containing protein n=1 Tax=Tigriopus californicus TaxID=6832 RepID=A0A553PCC4_TIGCA|nr:uncharacterized protein LOC131893259 [Tigriopus californicus]TRY75337.1 hypothetical protein TCAL_15600 [Tigriopus californicus]